MLILAGVGYWVYAGHLKLGAARDPSNNVIEIGMGSIEETVTAQGKLEPKQYVEVGTQVSGQLKVLHVNIGDTVKKGDLIAEIDPQVYESAVAGDEARLKTLQAQKAQAEAQQVQAQQKLTRSQTLFQQEAVSKEVLQDAETALKVAVAAVKSLAAQIDEAQSTVDGDKTKLSYTKIYAPMDGIVVSQSAQQGQTLNANQTAPIVVQVADLDTMTVRAQVAEADVSKLKPDMALYFTTLGSQRKWKGAIRQILPTPETINDVVLYDVLVDVENKDHQLMTGMSAQIFFELGNAENVPLIPVAVLGKHLEKKDSDLGQAYVAHVVYATGAIEDNIIYIGLIDRTNAEVKSGLAVGDKVVIPVIQSSGSAQSKQQGATPRSGFRARL